MKGISQTLKSIPLPKMHKHAWNEYNNTPAKRAVYGFRIKWGFSYSKATKQDLIDFIKGELYENTEWPTFCEKRIKANFDIVVSMGILKATIKR